MRDNKKKIDGKMSREEYLYHNTEMLLKKYRDVVWSIEVSAIQAQISFELEMDCKLEEFLEMSYAAGADLSGTNIQEQMRTLERNKKMLKIIETAVNVLRKKQVDGEEFYWILYYTYDSVNYSFVGNLVIGSYDITHYELEKHYSDYNDEADNLNINKIMQALMGSSLRPEINYNRPKLCVIWNLYISPEFRRCGIGGWLVENLEDILFFYTGTRTCGFVAFPCPGGKIAYEKETAPNRTDEMYQHMVNLIERHDFLEIDNTNYFFKKCDEEV